MRTRFIANFQGTRDRPPAVSDMRRIKQQPGETLQKYIQCFNNARLKISKVTEEAIISVFSCGVRDVKMKEELAMHEDLCTSLELFNLATKCARVEEGRLSLLELPTADPEEKKPKAKDLKRKGAAVLAAEPDTKRGRDQPEPSKDRPPGNAGLPPLPLQPRRNEDRHQDEGAGGFQEPRAIACILGGAQALAS